jgi:hypothetical protein
MLQPLVLIKATRISRLLRLTCASLGLCMHLGRETLRYGLAAMAQIDYNWS